MVTSLLFLLVFIQYDCEKKTGQLFIVMIVVANGVTVTIVQQEWNDEKNRRKEIYTDKRTVEA